MKAGTGFAQGASEVVSGGNAMPVRLIAAGLVLVILAGAGLVFYGYSLSPQPKPVHVEIPNDQFPQ
jgi:hypothetical protein